MSATGYYDPEMQMFCEEPHDADLRMLEFYRWLIEHNRLVICIPDDTSDQEAEAHV
jgi:hypothetical protein